MQICFSLFLIVAGAILMMVTLLRWFEMTGDAVDQRNWSKLILLIVAPFAVWMYPARVSAGRPFPVARHEPVRGFGGLPKSGIQEATPAEPPPPGTPTEFMGMPKIPPKKSPRAVDPEKLAKLRQKMKEQGMLPEKDE